MNRYSKSKTSLFLMELIITILLFSVCGAVCMKLYAASNALSIKTRELNSSVSCAQGFVEVMRGTDGSMDSIISEYPNAVKGGDGFFEVFYDENFVECGYESAKYVGDVSLYTSGAIQNMEVKIVRLSDYETIYTLSATKYMNKIKG